MTKFEEEFDNKVEIFDVIGNHNSMCCEVDQVKEVFADWQPQQALPVVPECVGSWIECVKGKNNNVLALLDDDNMPDEVNEWLFFQRNDDNINLILRAWLDGYTVEKPQLYRVCLLGGRHTLTRRHPRKTLPFNYTFLWSWSDELKEMREINEKVDLFTEQEIKAIDERYWQFAVPVEDEE